MQQQAYVIDVYRMGKPPNEAATMIWVVDRDPDLLQFLEACLVRSLGSEVRALRSGSAAIAALARTCPDVLLCELDLPDASGEDVAGTAGRLPRPPSIVLMSGDTDRLQRARHRADRLLPKPFPLRELVWSVGTLIAKGSECMRVLEAERGSVGLVPSRHRECFHAAPTPSAEGSSSGPFAPQAQPPSLPCPCPRCIEFAALAATPIKRTP